MSPLAEQWRMANLYPGVFIHALACVADDNTIGEGSRIWSGAVVRNGTVLGKDVSVAANAVLEGCHIGDGTHINPFVHIGPGIVVGRRCFIAATCVLCNDGWPSVDRDANGGWSPTPDWVTVRIGDDSAICTGAIVLPGVTIGHRCLIAAGAVCDKDVPDDHMLLRDGRIKPIDPSRIQRMRAA